MIYNAIQNRWMEPWNVGTSKVFQDGYDDPTYLTFKVEFDEWGASILDRETIKATTSFNAYQADYDQLPIGLLNCPSGKEGDVDNRWQNGADGNGQVFNDNKDYSAFQFLRSRNEDERAKYIYYFVNGLMEIQKDYPFIFKKISGLQELESFDPLKGQRIKKDTKITLECIEGLNLKMKTLMEFYRKAAWDDVYQRWILPENMREFKMIIYVFERRTFHDVQSMLLNEKNEMVMTYSDINANIPVKAYECCPCEFNITNQIWKGDYSADYSQGDPESTNIQITIKNVKTYYKNGLLNTELDRKYQERSSTSLSGNKNSTDNSISSKLEPLMIYDLVETLERFPTYGQIGQEAGITRDSITSGNVNGTINMVKKLWLNKNLLLENEDATENLYQYLHGRVLDGTSSKQEAKAINANGNEITASQYNELSDEEKQGYTFKTAADDLSKNTMAYNRLHAEEIDRAAEIPRAAWISTAKGASGFDSTKSLWGNIGSMTLNTLAGAKRQILVSGNSAAVDDPDSYVSVIDNLVSNSIYCSYACDRFFTNIFMMPPEPTKKKVKENIINNEVNAKSKLEGDLTEKPLFATEFGKNIPDVSLDLDSTSVEKKKEFYNNDSFRSKVQETLENNDSSRNKVIEDPNNIISFRDKKEETLENNDIVREKFVENLENNDSSRNKINEQIKNQEDYRDKVVEDFNTLDDVRDKVIEDLQNYTNEKEKASEVILNNSGEREKVEEDFFEVPEYRIIPQQALVNVEEKREKIQEEYFEIDNTRQVANEQIVNSEVKDKEERKINQEPIEEREVKIEEFLNLDNYKDLTPEEIVSLKEMAVRTLPEYSIETTQLIDMISKATTDLSEKFINIDNKTKQLEEAEIDILKNNKSIESINFKETEKRKQDIVNMINIVSTKSDEIKEGLVESISKNKEKLMNLSLDMIRKLPVKDLIINNKNTKEKGEEVILSLEDKERLETNTKLLGLSEDQYRQLSFQALVDLNQEMENSIESTHNLIGISKTAYRVKGKEQIYNIKQKKKRKGEIKQEELEYKEKPKVKLGKDIVEEREKPNEKIEKLY